MNKIDNPAGKTDRFTAFEDGGVEENSDDNNNSDSDDTLDDHGDSRQNETRLNYASEQYGEVGRRGDRDYFLFDGEADDTDYD